MAEQQQDNNNQQQQKPSNISQNSKRVYAGMNLDSVMWQKGDGFVSYALNAITEGMADDSSIVYQNEQANILCSLLPEGYSVIGSFNLIDEKIMLFWLLNKQTNDCEIGKITDCIYSRVINSPCLKFRASHPIISIQYRKTNCGLEVYWGDGINQLRYIDLYNLPFKEILDGCNNVITSDIDCNKLAVQPSFLIPDVVIAGTQDDGDLIAGTYQFAVQYSNALSEAYTAYYSVTDPIPIFDPNKITTDFNYHVGKSINVAITGIDITGIFEYINVAVIKTINNIVSTSLVGTYQITKDNLYIVYTGQDKSEIQLSIDDIFQKYEIYDTAGDLTVAQDILIPSQLTTAERISYQEIASQITLGWQTYRFNGNKFYQNPLNCVLYRGYMRDEIVPYEIVFLLKNGKQTDGFTIPGRKSIPSDLVFITNADTNNESLPTWKVYNTAHAINHSPEYNGSPTYEGPFQYGEFAYWESTEVYPCNSIYSEIETTPIRHHKFPDNLITPHFDNNGYIYPLGVKINVQQIVDLINNSSLTQEQKDIIHGFKIVRGNSANNHSIVAKGILRNVGKYERDSQTYYFPNYPYNDLREDPFISIVQTSNDTKASNQLEAFTTDDSKNRFVLNSPDTSFFQPILGTKLKIESELTGIARSHFVNVQKHSQYKFISDAAYTLAIATAGFIGFASATLMFGLSTGGQIFDGAAAFTAYQTLVDILVQTCPKLNYAYQYNSIGEYDNQVLMNNDGNKIRTIDIATYLIPGMQSVGDTYTVNNLQRESSIYIRTVGGLPFPSNADTSRFINSHSNCDTTILENPISSYYATIKSDFPNQYGQLYSYETIDTGYQKVIDLSLTNYTTETVFGGDTFINRFAFKTKIPFFIDNRVGFPDEADIDYRDFGNIAYPTYWFSTDTSVSTHNILGISISIPFIPSKINNFDCDTRPFFYQKGKIYLFAYGIPYFFTESRVNVDMRQAFNGQEGDFFPHTSSDIPDNWFQETNVSIKQDNTYNYNITYSKQNKENVFTHLPDDFTIEDCRRILPWRCMFSEPKTDSPNPSIRNNWRIYKPSSIFDFPQNYGRLVSLDGVENKEVLARFENKTLRYNSLLTAPTSAQEVYLGQPLFSSQVPPYEYFDTDSGYMGTQHRFLVRTEHGHIVADSKRGTVHLIPKQNSSYMRQPPVELTNKYVSKFFTTFLDFSIQKAFPDIDIDNHYSGIGLHGVYDPKYNRLILTKLDYELLDNGVTFDSSNYIFEKDGEQVFLTDRTLFCSKSFTISYDFDIQAWISFHTYLPNFYLPEANFFLSGNNDIIPSIWQHCTSVDKFNNFYGNISPYILEYPYSYDGNDQIIQNIKDYSRILQYTDYYEWIETNDAYFSEMVIFNNQECSGRVKLIMKPKNNLAAYNTYPKYLIDNKEVIVTKSNSFYQVNTFWDMVKDLKKPIWKKSCQNLSIQRELNQDNMDYGKRSYRKGPIRGKDLRIRYILDNRDDIKIMSQFSLGPSMQSYK